MSLEILNAFDVVNADIVVWAFKKSGGSKGVAPTYNGRWIQTTDELKGALREAVTGARTAITETIEYGLLAQNNEGSALTLGLEETYASYVLAQAADPTPARKVKNLKEIRNSTFYVVKLSAGGTSIYGVRKTDDSWRTKKAKSALSVVFKDNLLTLEEGVHFSISKYFDFFIVGDEILITNKGNFESLLSYREAHIEEFESLRKEPEFIAIFKSLTDLIEYVGTNKIQLRRVSAIRQKGHYKDSDFMKRLRKEAGDLGFKIAFDGKGRIVPTPESCRDIFQALLDHRLDSRLSNKLYDVENTADVNA